MAQAVSARYETVGAYPPRPFHLGTNLAGKYFRGNRANVRSHGDTPALVTGNAARAQELRETPRIRLEAALQRKGLRDFGAARRAAVSEPDQCRPTPFWGCLFFESFRLKSG